MNLKFNIGALKESGEHGNWTLISSNNLPNHAHSVQRLRNTACWGRALPPRTLLSKSLTSLRLVSHWLSRFSKVELTWANTNNHQWRRTKCCEIFSASFHSQCPSLIRSWTIIGVGTFLKSRFRFYSCALFILLDRNTQTFFAFRSKETLTLCVFISSPHY